MFYQALKIDQNKSFCAEVASIHFHYYLISLFERVSLNLNLHMYELERNCVTEVAVVELWKQHARPVAYNGQ